MKTMLTSMTRKNIKHMLILQAQYLQPKHTTSVTYICARILNESVHLCSSSGSVPKCTLSWVEKVMQFSLITRISQFDWHRAVNEQVLYLRKKKHAVYLPVLCTFSIRAVVWLWPCWHVTTWQLIGRFCWIPCQFIDGARAICSQTAACLDCDGSAVLRAGPFWFFKFLEYPFCMLTWYITVPNESQKEIKQTAWKKQRTNRGVWIRLNQGRPDGLSFRRIRAPATNIAWSLGSWARGGTVKGHPLLPNTFGK